MYKFIRPLMFLLVLVAGSQAQAQDDISGVWAGTLQVAPDTRISVHFTLSRENGQWQAVLNSPDMGAIKNVPASSVRFDGTALDIEVASLSGSYAGRLVGGSFAGEWRQPGGNIPMALTPYSAAVLSDEAASTLLGSWIGKLVAPGISFTIMIAFSRNEAGEVVGTLTNVDAGTIVAFIDSPNQGAAGLVVTSASLVGGKLDLALSVPPASYSGTLSDDVIDGSWIQNGGRNPLQLKRE